MDDWRTKYAKLISDYPHEVGVEVGVLKGENTVTLLSNLTGLKKLYCVDSWSNKPGPTNMSMYLQAVKLYEGRVKTLHMKSVEASELVEDGAVDFVFIDAFHTYEAVAKDIDCWFPKIKMGGILSGHDYIDYEKTKVHNPANYNVKKAIDELFSNANIDGRVWWAIKK